MQNDERQYRVEQQAAFGMTNALQPTVELHQAFIVGECDGDHA